MAAGLGTLRLAPRDFWAMTPRELDAALRGVFGMGAGGLRPSAGDLAALMVRYPDTTKDQT
ncbi:hypothetical protein A7A08_02131 [Methyloligella halotolerans]|uniref:Phage tail assembly chaperone n=1 Tax=Methyloligella halotolerans TaxID=1177755 RepID=A0A1E2RX89_9HYPH|nr:hypothetical protein A7A08_02131 [Methyloligella halotolerans]